MPYIEQNKRPNLDIIVEEMLDAGLNKPDGNLNYVLFKLAKFIVPSYNNYKNFIGELNECVAEIRRKLLSSYEDIKEQQNGKIDC
jgi:hypothetical protein